MKVKNDSGKTGTLKFQPDTVKLDFKAKDIIYKKQNIESISVGKERPTLPAVGLVGSFIFTLITFFIDFGSLVSFETKFINISSILSGIGTLLLLSSIIALVYFGYKVYTIYTYSTRLVIKGSSGDKKSLQIPKDEDIDIDEISSKI